MPIRNPEIVKQFLARQDRVERINGAIPLGPDVQLYRQDPPAQVMRLGGGISLSEGQNLPQISLGNIPDSLSLSDIEQGVAAILAQEAYNMTRWQTRGGVKVLPVEEGFMAKMDQVLLVKTAGNQSYFKEVLNRSRTAWIEHFKNS